MQKEREREGERERDVYGWGEGEAERGREEGRWREREGGRSRLRAVVPVWSLSTPTDAFERPCIASSVPVSQLVLCRCTVCAGSSSVRFPSGYGGRCCFVIPGSRRRSGHIVAQLPVRFSFIGLPCRVPNRFSLPFGDAHGEGQQRG